MTTPVLRRVVRRETHSPRTVAMIVAVVLVILALAYVGTEIVLSLLGQPALLLGPGAAFAWVVGLPTAIPQGVSVVIGAVMGILGIVLIVLAVTPGRLAKHELTGGSGAVVSDNGVIASALASRISEETGIPREQVRVGVAHRRVDVILRPTAGVVADVDAVRAAADAEIDAYRLVPRVRTRVRVEQSAPRGEFS